MRAETRPDTPSRPPSRRPRRTWRPLGLSKRLWSGAGAALLGASSLLALSGNGTADEQPATPPLGARIVAAAATEVRLALPPLPNGARPFLASPDPRSDGRIPALPTPAPAPVAGPAAGGADAPVDDRRAMWDRLADCESGDWRDGSPLPDTRRWDYGLSFSHGDIYEGGLNFHPATWDQYRGGDLPDHAGHAAPEQQIAVAEQVLADQGWGAWPVCSRMLGLRG